MNNTSKYYQELIDIQQLIPRISSHRLFMIMRDIIDESDKENTALKARVAELEWGLMDAFLFSNWVECLGRTDCEIYKHELKASADLSIERIHKLIDVEKFEQISRGES